MIQMKVQMLMYLIVGKFLHTYNVTKCLSNLPPDLSILKCKFIRYFSTLLFKFVCGSFGKKLHLNNYFNFHTYLSFYLQLLLVCLNTHKIKVTFT